jgi:tetratricopeptide (TPR) repeat protein
MDRSHRQLIARGCALGLVVASLVACSAVQPLAVPSSPPPAETTTGGGDVAAPAPSASSALLDQSRAARAAGNYAAAAVALDRALRIAPNDPALWLEYGELRMAEGDYRQAATLARKSVSLAGENRAVRNAASDLIAGAERAQGGGSAR